jgi:hypothetical protein
LADAFVIEADERSPRVPVWGWWALVVLVLLEAGLYRQYVLHEVVPLPPAFVDQTVYLGKSYRIHQSFRDHGLRPTLVKAFTEPCPNGVLQPIAAALVYFVSGPSRLGALTVNFLAFALFQFALVYYLLWRTRRWSVAFLGPGLLLTAATIAQPCGGLIDFRFDFPVMCLYGVLLCLVLRSQTFLLRRWSAAVGVAGAVLILFRFFTGVYLAGIASFFVLWCLLRWLRSRNNPADRRAVRQRIAGVLLAGLIATSLSLPVAVFHARAVWNYYGGNVLLGGDRDIRIKEFGIETTWDALTFYPRSIYHQHTGQIFLVLCLGTALACLGLGWLWRKTDTRPLQWLDRRASAIYLALAVAVPLTLLTLAPSKSPVVGGICVAPLLCLALLPAVGLADRLPARAGLVSGLFPGLAALALVCGGGFQLGALARPFLPGYGDPDRQQLQALYDTIDRAIQHDHLTSPVLSTDMLHDFLLGPTIDVALFERSGKLRNLGQSLLGSTVFAVSENDVLLAARRSDFVLVHDSAEGGYPFNQAMTRLRPRLREVCEREFLLLAEFRILGVKWHLYQRPLATLQSRYPDWLDRDGLTITGSSALFRRFPVVQVTGRYCPELLGGRLGVKAALVSGEEVPVVVEELGGHYRLTVRLDDVPLAEKEVAVQVRFDRWFVPRDLGIGQDRRQLAVRKPDDVRLRPLP